MSGNNEVLSVLFAQDTGKVVLEIIRKPTGEVVARASNDMLWDDLTPKECTELYVAFMQARKMIIEHTQESESKNET